MARYVFKLPDIGEGIAESEIANWRVEAGQTVAEDQPLVDMLTDKAAVEIPSPVAGRVLERLGQAGDKIAVGAPLIVIETGAAAEAAEQPAGALAVERTPLAPWAAQSESQATRPAASPAVRRRAREAGVPLDQVKGTGPRGRVTRKDIEACLSGTSPPMADRSRQPALPPRAATDGIQIEAVRVIGLRRKIAEAMQRSKQRIPHFAYVEELDVTEVERLREQLNQMHGASRGKLTLLPFLIRAIVQARAAFPQMNATYDDEAGITYRHCSVHAGVATQTANGLVVPVVRHAEALDPWQVAAEVRRLSDAARAGRASREELSGSTITISSLGALGGIVSTPVINYPEVAIIGVNRMAERPVVRDGQVIVRRMMNLSSSFDHRIVDGSEAAGFIQQIKMLLEMPSLLFVQ